MSTDEASTLAMLARAFENLGAEPASARTMAGQLLKRARQVASERGVSETEALGELLQKVAQGRRGEWPPSAGGE